MPHSEILRSTNLCCNKWKKHDCRISLAIRLTAGWKWWVLANWTRIRCSTSRTWNRPLKKCWRVGRPPSPSLRLKCMDTDQRFWRLPKQALHGLNEAANRNASLESQMKKDIRPREPLLFHLGIEAVGSKETSFTRPSGFQSRCLSLESQLLGEWSRPIDRDRQPTRERSSSEMTSFASRNRRDFVQN